MLCFPTCTNTPTQLLSGGGSFDQPPFQQEWQLIENNTPTASFQETCSTGNSDVFRALTFGKVCQLGLSPTTVSYWCWVTSYRPI